MPMCPFSRIARQAPKKHSQMNSSCAMSTDQISGWPKLRMIAATNTSSTMIASSAAETANSSRASALIISEIPSGLTRRRRMRRRGPHAQLPRIWSTCLRRSA